jgi:hypothetical protein
MDGLEDKVPKAEAFASVGGSSAKSDDSDLEFLGAAKDGNDPF